MVTHDGFQAVTLEYHCKHVIHTILAVYKDIEDSTEIIVKDVPVVFDSGYGKTSVLLPVQDEYPNFNLVTFIKEWNKKWKYPKLRTLGNPNEPFELLRKYHDEEIPVLHGDITGGWYQHPISAAELLSQKFEADRLLPTAEKWAVIASLVDKNYEYPSIDFDRAWNYLLYNDEHSYGTSGYQGRRVYETWIQHRDWITKAESTGRTELSKAIDTIASKIKTDECKTVVFNQTLQKRTELIEKDGKFVLTEIPPLGYITLSDNTFITTEDNTYTSLTPPTVENRFYIVVFAENGSIISIYDKQLGKELVNNGNYNANELLYTVDNHKTFTSPQKATFSICENSFKITIVVKSFFAELKSELVSEISMPCHEKRIDIDNRIYHAAI